MVDDELHIQPGSFRDASDEVPKYSDQALPEIQPSASLVEIFNVFLRSEKPEVHLVYVPCCGQEVSPSGAFIQSRVVYVDRDEETIRLLHEHHYDDAYVGDANTFQLDSPADVLVLLNPAIDHAKPAEQLRRGGYVLCNDYHSTATDLRDDPAFEFVGIIHAINDRMVLDKESLDQCWQDVETEEELVNAPFSFGRVYYQTAYDVVTRILGKSENILEEYKALMQLARDQQSERIRQFKQDFPDALDLNLDTSDTALMLHVEGDSTPVLLPLLPKKKGTVDDIFVFKKR